MKAKWELPALALVLLAGLLVRAAYLAENRRNPDFAYPAVDAGYHDYWARALATGDWTLHGRLEYDPKIPESPYFRPPGYPYFLALVYRLGGPSYFVPRIVQHGLGLLNVLLLYALARRWIGRAAAVAAAALMAGYWIQIYFEEEFLEPVLVVFLGLAMLLALASILAKPRKGLALLAGLLLAISALARPNALVFAPFAALWLAWISGWRRRGWVLATLFGVGGVGGLLPTAVRNWTVGGDRVLISANAGINLYIGNNPRANGGFVDVGDGAGGGFGTSDVYPVIQRQLERQAGHSLEYSEISRHFAREAGQFIRENPGRFAQLLGIKTILFWGPYEAGHNKYLHFERANSPVLRKLPLGFADVLTLAMLGLLAPLAAGRSGAAEKDRRAVFMLLGGFVLAQYLSFLPFFVTGQYRAPVLPALFVFAGWGIARMAGLWRERRWARLFLMLALGAALHGALGRDVLGVRVNPAEWHQARGQAWSRANQPVRAAAEYEAALSYAPDNAYAHYNLGNALMKTGQSEAARAHFAEALRLRPDFGQAAFNLAMALNAAGDRAGAIARLREAIPLMPDSALPRLQLGNLLQQTGAPAAARAEYEAAVELDPRNEMAWYALAQARKAADDRAAARQILRDALQVLPEAADLRNSLAWELAIDPAVPEDALRESLALAQQGAARDPDNVGYLDTLGTVLARLGRFAEARQQAEKALALARRNGSAREAEMIAEKLRRFERNQPYVEP